MRLIDADALLEKKYINEGKNTVGVRSWIAFSEIEEAPTASPWNMIEDGLPEPHKNVLVSGMEAINNSRVYKVMVNDDGTWRPMDYAPSILWDYCMP